MNIFILDKSPVGAAKYHCNKHLIKQLLECAQLLSTAVRLTGGDYGYKVTHRNHPCAIWARTTKGNFGWLQHLGMELGWEYTHRYGKIHKSAAIIENAPADTIPDGPLMPFVQCMPDECKGEDAVEAYRKYYREHKSHILVYTKRDPPEWLGDLAIRK